MTTVVVFGGAGFLGRRLVLRLTTEGMTVRVAVRHPDHARIELQSIGFDRVTVVPADVCDQASVATAIAGADAVVNTVSAYVEKGGVTFEAVHVQGAQTVAREAVAAGVARLVLVSGIGADADSGSPYIRARGRGEQVVHQTFPEATIVRPGAMFGPGDALFGTLAELARLLPILPLIGGNVISNAGVAALAAYAALRSAALNGYTNGKMISDKAFAEAKLKELGIGAEGVTEGSLRAGEEQAELTGIQRRPAKPIGDQGGNRWTFTSIRPKNCLHNSACRCLRAPLPSALIRRSTLQPSLAAGIGP